MPTKSPSKRRTKAKTKKRRRASKVPLLRTSEGTSFDRCRWAWNLGYNEELQPVRQAPALRFGTLVHAALEKRYPPGIRRGPNPAETFEKLYLKDLRKYEKEGWSIKDTESEEWENALDLGIDMLEGYVEEYGRDEDWKVIASEMTFKVPVYNSAGILIFYYVGTMDGVWQNRIDGRVRIIDYKTTSGDPVKEAQSKFVLDEQATAYWSFGADHLITKKILKQREQESLDGMFYVFLKKAKGDLRPRNPEGLYLNQDGSVSKKQPTPRFHRELVFRGEADRIHGRERAIQRFREMQLCKLGELPIRKSPGTGYPDMQCQACSFRDVCELHEADADWETMLKVSTTHWDPYAAHEIQEEGKY